jgi:hypothetical protein
LVTKYQISEGGECADALAASDNEGSRGENVFLSMRTNVRSQASEQAKGDMVGLRMTRGNGNG